MRKPATSEQKAHKSQYDKNRRSALGHVLLEKKRIYYAENRSILLERMKLRYAKDKTQLLRYYSNRELVLEQKRIIRLNNLEQFRTKDKESYRRNRDKELEAAKIYRIQNAEKMRKRERDIYAKNRLEILRKQREWNSTIHGKLYVMARNTAKRLVDLGGVKPCKSLELLGGDLDAARNHIESQFKPGMTWSNHGRRTWHIDHIRPLASFDLTNPEEFRKAVHYTNLQPMWWRENISKANKYEGIVFKSPLVGN